ncbi:MAG: hypothetical protein GY702_18735 [Desulfobulbaceae bacterium]|nr:hypothetical protein [Desulfobulbaceae bacterium]
MARMADYLDLIQDHLPDEVVSQDAYGEIRSVASCLPGTLAFSCFIFECLLSSPDCAADFSIFLSKDDYGAEVLAGILPEHDFAPELWRFPQWKIVRDVGRLWTTSTDPEWRDIADAWLEFDIKSSRVQLPIPNLFVNSRHLFNSGDHEDSFKGRAADFASSLYRVTQQRALSLSAHKGLLMSLDRLPKNRSVCQMGRMIARDTADDRLRLVIHMSADELISYLTDIGWSGDINEVAKMVLLLQDQCKIALALDVGEEVGEQIGIECFPHVSVKNRQQMSTWVELLQLFVQRGLCLPEKAAVLGQFFGKEANNRGNCPPQLRRVIDENHLIYWSFFSRSISHVKLVYHSPGEWQAKCYLQFRHHWQSATFPSIGGVGKWGAIG